jgi:ectoine hydroxylase-related dioxygenase (phytanoyl-CoA dioxygenase family)
MDMATALAGLGVTEATLDAETAERLDRDGYVLLPGVLNETQLTAIRARLGELMAAEGDQAGLEVHQEAGTDRLADLVNKGEMFWPCFTDPRVLACIAHVLGDFKLSSLNFRAALPGHGHQNLHTDWGGPVEPGEYQVCNSIWLLDDFTASNGATRVVPGSHRARAVPRLALADPAAPHPGEVLITAPAGTVVVFNSHLWHGGTQNRGDRPRRAAHAYFTRRGHGQQLDQRKYIRPQTLAALSPAARFILDVS